VNPRETGMDRWWRKHRKKCVRLWHHWNNEPSMKAAEFNHPLGVSAVHVCAWCDLIRVTRAYRHVEYVREINTKVPS